MNDSLEVEASIQPDGGEGLAKRKGFDHIETVDAQHHANHGAHVMLVLDDKMQTAKPDRNRFGLPWNDRPVVHRLIMPGAMNGRRLVDEAVKRRPALKALFTSGYTENAILHHGRLDASVLLLAKPYRKSELARMIRVALAGAR
jgi:hypothetical protein